MIELAKTSITEGFDVDNCFAYYEFWLILFGMIAALMTETHLLNMAMAHYEMLYGTYSSIPISSMVLEVYSCTDAYILYLSGCLLMH